jgi:hypothetical protein
MPPSFLVTATFSAHIDEKQLNANLGAQAANFGAEKVTLNGASEGGWTVQATFPLKTEAEANKRMGDLLTASGAPPVPITIEPTPIVDLP